VPLSKNTIIGALGYNQFFSEYSVYRRDKGSILLDGRRRDRIDILAVGESEVLDQAGVRCRPVLERLQETYLTRSELSTEPSFSGSVFLRGCLTFRERDFSGEAE
jgi:hypothetical protein